MRLGEMLVANGLLKEADVEKGLELQKVRGGRLGTNLVALRLVTEDQLAMVLASQMNREAAKWEDFEGLSAEVVDTLPMELADIHSAIPLRMDPNRITIGVSSPIELVAKERLEKMIGFSIAEVIAPEVWIAAALERYYNISREWRFDQSLDLLAQDGCSLLLPASLMSCFNDNKWKIASGKREERFLRCLFESDTPKHALNEMMEYLWPHYPRQVVFSIEGDDVRGWIARGFPTHAVIFHETTLPLKKSETLSKMIQADTPYHGELNLDGEEASLFRPLALSGKTRVSLYPITVEGRPLAIFGGWTDAGNAVEERQDTTHWAIEKLNLGLRILALRYHLFRENI